MAFRYTQKQHYIQPYYRKDTTHSSGGDYLDYISNLENAPRYPSVNNDVNRNDIGLDYDQDMDGTIHIEHHHHHHHDVPEGQHGRSQRVRFVESPVNGGIERRRMKPKEKKGGAIVSVDDEADSFIKANHRGFEISRWNTFTT